MSKPHDGEDHCWHNDGEDVLSCCKCPLSWDSENLSWRVAIDPIKLCCFRPQSDHDGVQCPDGKVMCCHCFFRFPVEELWVDPEDGRPVDICKTCKQHEDEVIERKRLA